MTTLEQQIIEELKVYHNGKNRAVKFNNLAEIINVNERELRNIVAHLITDYQIPIGSSQQGYFFIASDDDFQVAHGELINRIKKLSRRAKGLRIGWTREKQEIKPKQLLLI